VETAF